jgi:hypothetical protein
MSTFDDLLAKRTPESRERITARAEEIRREITLAKIREELDLSTTQVAESALASQPAIVESTSSGCVSDSNNIVR